MFERIPDFFQISNQLSCFQVLQPLMYMSARGPGKSIYELISALCQQAKNKLPRNPSNTHTLKQSEPKLGPKEGKTCLRKTSAEFVFFFVPLSCSIRLSSKKKLPAFTTIEESNFFFALRGWQVAKVFLKLRRAAFSGPNVPNQFFVLNRP